MDHWINQFLLQKFYPYILGGILAPSVAFGATFWDILIEINNIFSLVIPILIGLALIYFLWGVAQYVVKQGDETAQGEARSMMLYGIIALFVMISVWGLVQVLNSTFKINAGGAPTVPQLPGFPDSSDPGSDPGSYF